MSALWRIPLRDFLHNTTRDFRRAGIFERVEAFFFFKDALDFPSLLYFSNYHLRVTEGQAMRLSWDSIERRIG